MENYIWKWISKFLLIEKLFASSFLPLSFQSNLNHKASISLVTNFCNKNQNFLWKSSDQRRTILWTQENMTKSTELCNIINGMYLWEMGETKKKTKKTKTMKTKIIRVNEGLHWQNIFDFFEDMGRKWAKTYFWKNFKFIFRHQLLHHWITLIVIKSKILAISMRKQTINKQKNIYIYIYIIYIYICKYIYITCMCMCVCVCVCVFRILL